MTGRALNEYRRYDSSLYLNHGNENTGCDWFRLSEMEAEKASAQLRDATHALFRKWEHDNGFVEGAAQILLPAGWRAR